MRIVTYSKIKETLIDAGVPKEEIAIKTGDKDELKYVDLLSSHCPIRYIITVNALKEGWDCPFAYVLATVANRTSVVDVEQFLGRVLRLPYTQKNASNVLNISYVITSSADFHTTLKKVVNGLNNAGFSSKDYRAKDVETEPKSSLSPDPVQMGFIVENEPDIPVVDTGILRERIEQAMEPQTAKDQDFIEADELLAEALVQHDEYEMQVSNNAGTAIDLAPAEVRDKMNTFKMNDIFVEEAAALRFPQFMLNVGPSFFSDNDRIPLELEHLSEGFTLKDKDVQIDFSTIEAKMARVDTDDATDATPRAWRLHGIDSAYYKEWFNAQPPNIRLAHCKGLIKAKIAKLNCINDRELQGYIDRVVDTLTEDQLSDMEQSTYPYIIKVEQKIKALLATHRANMFDLWLEQGKIVCNPNYALKPIISPTSFTSTYPKSLYTSEEDMNEYERKTVWSLSSRDNIKWWHRNISRLGFQINGAIHAYPDIIAMTTTGKILMIETKGDHLDNDESKAKAKIGHQWANLAGSQYKYFMVFQSKSPNYPGAYSYDRFMEIVKGL